MGFGDKSVVGDRWSSRILWVCALGTAFGFYMVAAERQMQNREKALAGSSTPAESGAEAGK